MPRITSSSGRYYEYQGNKYPSVTTILSRGVAKPGLINWMGKSVAEAAYDRFPEWIELDRADAIDFLTGVPNSKKNTAANLGSYLHAAVERISLGQEVHKPADEVQQTYLNGFLSFLSDVNPEYVYTEFEVYSNTYGYAGTGDAIIRINGQHWLIDTKTGNKIRPDVALQLAAYRHADFILLHRPDPRDGRKKVYEEVALPRIRRTGVLHLAPDRYEFVEVRSDEEIFDAFLAAKTMFEWDSALSRVAIREVIAPNEQQDAYDSGH